MKKIIRVLVVDDSAYVRKIVREMLSYSPHIEVVGTARNGREALEMVESLLPDVVTSDLMMPELDGVGFVREQMRRRALPIVMMSSQDENSSETLAALDAGAVDFVQKPTALATEKILEVRGELIEKIKTAAHIPVDRLQPFTGSKQKLKTGRAETKPHRRRFDVIVIGISTGGPQALRYLIPQFPADFPVPIAIVLHMPVGYTAPYAEKLNELAALEVREAREGDELTAGRVLLAPAGKHLMLKRRIDDTVRAHLSLRPMDTPHRPAVDVLFQSASEAFADRTLAVVMTGMGADGQMGAAWIKARSGTVFTEAEDTCVVYGMPGAVVEAGLSDKIVRLDQLEKAILEVV